MAVLVDRFHGADQQLAILQGDIVPGVHILLELLVDPARLMQLHIPAAPVQHRTVEVVLKNQFVILVREHIVHFGSASLQRFKDSVQIEGVHPGSRSKAEQQPESEHHSQRKRNQHTEQEGQQIDCGQQKCNRQIDQS